MWSEIRNWVVDGVKNCVVVKVVENGAPNEDYMMDESRRLENFQNVGWKHIIIYMYVCNVFWYPACVTKYVINLFYYIFVIHHLWTNSKVIQYLSTLVDVWKGCEGILKKLPGNVLKLEISFWKYLLLGNYVFIIMNIL